jgi:amino acid transporter
MQSCRLYHDLLIYASIAVAVPVLRKKQPDADAFRLPGGLFFVVLALLFTGLLVTRIRLDGLMALTATFALGLLNWFWAARSGKELTNQRT